MKAYSGIEGYAFVSYAHKDADKVLAVLDKLSLAGTRIWYDEGIAPSSDYIDVIAKKIDSCALFIAFISANSLASQYCTDEIRFAYESQKQLMVVRLDDTELPAGMKMILNRYQFYNYFETDSADDTSRKLLPSIPSQVVEQKGTRLFSDGSFTYYLQSIETRFSNQPGYRVVAVSKTQGTSFTLIEKRLPYGSEYDIHYVIDPRQSAMREFALNVTWDFTFAHQLPDDDFFMTRFVYKISWKNESTLPSIEERVVYRESYTTGEKIFYDYVEGQGTYVKRDGTVWVGSADTSNPLRLCYRRRDDD